VACAFGCFASNFDEIAAAAGVSVASADRTLNERGSVSPAARQLGVGRILPELHHKLIRLDLLLPQKQPPFFQQLGAALVQHIQMLDRRVLVQRRVLDTTDDEVIAKHILHSIPTRQGLIRQLCTFLWC
jgi:LacI family transcriptional regulator